MTKEAQRIAFAKALGWHSIENSGLLNFPWSGYPPKDYIIGQKRQLPDCDDLNVVHEAVRALDIDERVRWPMELRAIILHDNLDTDRLNRLDDTHFYNAPATQRTEAFLRTKGLWVESVDVPATT